MLALVGGLVLAQQPDVQQVAASIKQNQQSLRQYAWQSRVNVEVDGEEKRVTLYQVRYNMDGELEKTPMGGEADEKKVRGPIRKNVSKKKKKQAHEFAEDATAQVHAYMTPDAMSKAMAGAFSRNEGGMLKLRSENVLVDGDSIELALVENTRQPMTFDIETSVDESPLKVSVTFQALDDGTNYPARTVISTVFEKKELSITTENFSYVKQ